jgi:hypothetical protein
VKVGADPLPAGGNQDIPLQVNDGRGDLHDITEVFKDGFQLLNVDHFRQGKPFALDSHVIIPGIGLSRCFAFIIVFVFFQSVLLYFSAEAK